MKSSFRWRSIFNIDRSHIFPSILSLIYHQFLGWLNFKASERFQEKLIRSNRNPSGKPKTRLHFPWSYLNRTNPGQAEVNLKDLTIRWWIQNSIYHSSATGSFPFARDKKVSARNTPEKRDEVNRSRYLHESSVKGLPSSPRCQILGLLRLRKNRKITDTRGPWPRAQSIHIVCTWRSYAEIGPFPWAFYSCPASPFSVFVFPVTCLEEHRTAAKSSEFEENARVRAIIRFFVKRPGEGDWQIELASRESTILYEEKDSCFEPWPYERKIVSLVVSLCFVILGGISLVLFGTSRMS